MKTKMLSALVVSALLMGCGSSSESAAMASTESSAAITWAAAPMQASAGRMVVAARAEEGGKLVVSLSNPSLLVWQSDTLSWDGLDTLRAEFGQLPTGAGYHIKAQYLDAKGLCTHMDSVGAFALARAQVLPLRLLLAPVLGKIYLQFPEIPTEVDSLGLFVKGQGNVWKTTIARPTGGRGALRMDSLPLGVALQAYLRAWKKTGDTLYYLDTSVTLNSSEDKSLAWNFLSALSQSQAAVSFSIGGEAAATVGFAGTATAAKQVGSLLITGFSDSGSSDWVRLRNTTADSFCQMVKISRGTLDTTVLVQLASGEELIVTRATREILAQSGHPLALAKTITAGIATVTWSTTGGTVWKLESADGKTLLDQVYVLPGKSGWPSLNTTTTRTMALRPANASGLKNDAGSGWCGQGTDSPLFTCPN